MRNYLRLCALAGSTLAAFVLFGPVLSAGNAPQESQAGSAPKKIKVRMQARPGGPMEDLEIAVQEVPVDLPSVAAGKAPLKDHDLVLGVVIEGQAMAYPIRYLALYEVVDDRVGQTPVAPTW